MTLRRAGLHLVVLAICAVWLVPTVSLLVTSLRPAALLLTNGWWHVFTSPGQLTFANYRHVLGGGQLGRSFVNSLAIVVPVTVATVAGGAIGGYAFAWLPFRGDKILLVVLI